MTAYNRIFTIVMDSLGVGALPDAENYNDKGTDTLGHIAQNREHFSIPNLQKLGIANLHPLKSVEPIESPMGCYAYLYEASTGKDTMTGHWEMMGLHITKPFKTFTDTGFPKELLDELSPAAQMIGAVNTVVNDNGKLIGYNTDGIGFMKSVIDAGHDVIGKNITVMGAGGAATAICAQAA